MAYGTKYTIESVQSQTGDTWTVYIKERDYTGSTTELDPGCDLVTIQYTPQGFYGATSHWNIAPSTCTVEFVDDTTGKLAEVLDGDDEKYQILVEDTTNTQDEWLGFVIPDSYSYSLYSKGISRLRAHDRLMDLQNLPYSPGGDVLYSGRATLLEVLTRCLDSTTLGIGIATHLNWYPHIGSNELTTTDDPMVNLRVNQEAFRDTDDNPFSKFSVLQQVCMRFQLQILQVESRWHVIHRKKNVFDSSGDVFKVYNYTIAGAAGSPTTTNLDARKEVSVDNDSGSFVISPSITGTMPYGEVAATYFHGNPFTGLFFDLSFEAPAPALQPPVGGTPLVNEPSDMIVGQQTISFDGVPVSVNIPSETYFTIDTDSTETLYKFTEAAIVNGSGQATDVPFLPPLAEAVLNNDGITFLEHLGGWAEFDDATHTTSATNGEGLTPDDTHALQLDVEFNTTASYDKWVRQRSLDIVGGGSTLRLKTGWSIKAEGGQTATTSVMHAFKMYVEGTSTTWYFKWSDTTWTTTDTTNEIDMFNFGWLDDEYHFLNIITDFMTLAATDITGYLWIEFYEGREHDDTTNSQTVTDIYVDNVVEPVIILTDGTPSNEATQTRLTYEGNVNRGMPDIPTLVIGDGPTAGHKSRLTVYDSAGAEQSTTGDWSYLPSAASSGFSLDQFWANQILREYASTNKKIRASLYSKETATAPKPYHYLLLENPDTTAQFDYTWQDLTWQPASHKNVLAGTFVQFRETTTADQICTVDVKPNTALLSGLKIDEGLVCGATVDFTPTNAATHLYIAEGTTPPTIYRAPISDTAPWTATTITTITTGRTIIHMHVDQSAGYIFTLENVTSTAGNKLMRYNLDGSGLIELIDDTDAFLVNFNLGKKNKYLYTSWLAGAFYSIKRYDYDGTSVDTVITASGTKAQGLGVDQTEEFMYYKLTKSGDDPIIKHTIASGSESDLITNSVTSDSGESFWIHPDAAYNKVLMWTSAENNSYEIDITSPSESVVLTGVTAGEGFAIDRLRRKLYVAHSSTGDVYQYNYNGTGGTEIVDLGAGASTIEALSTGFD